MDVSLIELRIETAVNRGYFAVLSLKRDNFLAVDSVNIHDIYLNTQLRTLYIDINIVKLSVGSDMLPSCEFKKRIFHFYFLNINISLTIKVWHSKCSVPRENI